MELSPLSDLGLPIVLLQDGTRYEGDYTDIRSEDIKESVTKAYRDFSVTYFATKGLFSSLETIADVNSTPYPDNLLARIVEVS